MKPGPSLRHMAVLAAAFAVLLSSLVTGTAGARPVTAAQSSHSLATVTLGIGSDPATLLYVVAAKQGFLKKYGINANLRQFQSGVEALAAQVSGDVQLTSVTELPASGAMAKGAPFKIVGTMGTSFQNFGAVANSDVRSAKDLLSPGTKIGVTVGSGGQYWLYQYAQKNGLDYSKLNTVNVGVADMVAAFSRGDIQAYFSWTPYVQQGISIVKGAHVLGYSGNYGYPTTMYILMSDSVAANKRVGRAILHGLLDASKWVATHRSDALNLEAQTLNVPTSAISLPMSLFDYRINFKKQQVASLKSVAAWAQTNQLIMQQPDWKSYVWPSLLKQIAPKLVTATS